MKIIYAIFLTKKNPTNEKKKGKMSERELISKTFILFFSLMNNKILIKNMSKDDIGILAHSPFFFSIRRRVSFV